MPYLAEQEDESIIEASEVTPEQKDCDYTCPYCGDTVGYRKAARRDDGSIRARSHFWHYERVTQNSSSGGCTEGGESREHELMKKGVFQELQKRTDIPSGTVYIEKEIGNRTADVLYMFDTPEKDSSSTTKRGIIVETQFKNHNKDYLQVTRNALKHGFSIHWVFHTDEMSELMEAKEELEIYTDDNIYIGEYSDEELHLGEEIYYDNFTYEVRGVSEFKPPSFSRAWNCWWMGSFKVEEPRGYTKDITVYTFQEDPDLEDILYTDWKGAGALESHFKVPKIFQRNTDGRMVRLSPIEEEPEVQE